MTRRGQFNFEVRRVFNIPSPGETADLTEFYLDNFINLADRIRPEVNRNDLVQLEIISEHVQNHVIFNVDESTKNIVLPFYYCNIV